jgi:serine/threonine protein kinase
VGINPGSYFPCVIKIVAPEMLKSEKYGHAVDWYALGAVLCALLLSKVNFLLI